MIGGFNVFYLTLKSSIYLCDFNIEHLALLKYLFHVNLSLNWVFKLFLIKFNPDIPPQEKTELSSHFSAFVSGDPAPWKEKSKPDFESIPLPLILDRGQRNLVGPSGPPIIWPTLINGPGPGQNYGEMAVNGRFYALPKSGKRAENPFFSKITPKIGQKTDIYLGKGYFFLCTTLPGCG